MTVSPVWQHLAAIFVSLNGIINLSLRLLLSYLVSKTLTSFQLKKASLDILLFYGYKLSHCTVQVYSNLKKIQNKYKYLKILDGFKTLTFQKSGLKLKTGYRPMPNYNTSSLINLSSNLLLKLYMRWKTM